MSEMLTLIKSWFVFCQRLHLGCPVVVLTCNVQNKTEQLSASKDEFKIKHREKYCPYHLWTNFIITCLEDERGRGELNVRGDKGIKNTFSTRQRANHSEIRTYYASTYTVCHVIMFWVHEYGFQRGELAVSHSSCFHQLEHNVMCSEGFVL